MTIRFECHFFSLCSKRPHLLISLFCSDFLNNLVSRNFSDVIKEYNENLFGYKRRVSVIDDKNHFEGLLIGIDEDGCLIISRDSKECKVNNINSTLRLL